MGLLDHMVVVYLVFKGTTILFSIMDWKTQYHQNDDTTQGTFQIQCDPY